MTAAGLRTTDRGEPRETLHERAAYHGYRTLARIAEGLPEAAGRGIFERIGLIAFRALPGLRATVLANQAQVLGRPVTDPLVRASARTAFRLYARYWFDTFRVVSWSDERILEAFEVGGFENMELAAAGGKGVVAVLPHMGNWDVAGRFMAAKGYPILSVAERLKPDRLFRLFLEHRRALRMDIVALGDAGLGGLLRAELGRGRVVALVADRDLTGQGIEVEMFGRMRRLPAGPAMLSIATGAPVMVTPIYHRRGGWHCEMYRPLEPPHTGDRRADVTSLTRSIAAALEQAISAAPADWHLFQPGWDPADP